MGYVLKFVKQGMGEKAIPGRKDGVGRGVSAGHIQSDDLLSMCKAQA